MKYNYHLIIAIFCFHISFSQSEFLNKFTNGNLDDTLTGWTYNDRVVHSTIYDFFGITNNSVKFKSRYANIEQEVSGLEMNKEYIISFDSKFSDPGFTNGVLVVKIFKTTDLNNALKNIQIIPNENVWSNNSLSFTPAESGSYLIRLFKDSTDSQGNNTSPMVLDNLVFKQDAIEGNYAKKGAAFSFKNFQWASRLTKLKPEWFYNWSYNSRKEIPKHIEYVPMFHGISGVTQTAIDHVLDLAEKNWNNEQKMTYVLGFNEPNNKPQDANSVAQGIAAWTMLCDAFRDISYIKLGAPAPSASGVLNEDLVFSDTGEITGYGWIVDFMNQVNNDADLYVDFMTMHCYKTKTNFKQCIDNIHEIEPTKPIWITEFGLGDFTANWNPDGGEVYNENKHSTTDVTELMDYFFDTILSDPNYSFIHRYAWFNGEVSEEALHTMALFDENEKLTPLGENYRDKIYSNPYNLTSQDNFVEKFDDILSYSSSFDRSSNTFSLVPGGDDSCIRVELKDGEKQENQDLYDAGQTTGYNLVNLTISEGFIESGLELDNNVVKGKQYILKVKYRSNVDHVKIGSRVFENYTDRYIHVDSDKSPVTGISNSYTALVDYDNSISISYDDNGVTAYRDFSSFRTDANLNVPLSNYAASDFNDFEQITALPELLYDIEVTNVDEVAFTESTYSFRVVPGYNMYNLYIKLQMNNMDPSIDYFLEVDSFELKPASLDENIANEFYGYQEVTTLKVALNKNSNVGVYPVPTSDVLNVSFEQVVSKINIYSVSGNLELSKRVNAKHTTLNVENLKRGTYVLQVLCKDRIVSKLIHITD